LCRKILNCSFWPRKIVSGAEPLKQDRVKHIETRLRELSEIEYSTQYVTTLGQLRTGESPCYKKVRYRYFEKLEKQLSIIDAKIASMLSTLSILLSLSLIFFVITTDETNSETSFNFDAPFELEGLLPSVSIGLLFGAFGETDTNAAFPIDAPFELEVLLPSVGIGLLFGATALTMSGVWLRWPKHDKYLGDYNNLYALVKAKVRRTHAFRASILITYLAAPIIFGGVLNIYTDILADFEFIINWIVFFILVFLVFTLFDWYWIRREPNNAPS